MDTADLRRNLRLYIWQRAYTSFLVYIPISLIFYLNAGLTIGQIGILNSLTALVLVVLDIPAGYLADYYSRRGFLVGGILVQAAGFALCSAFPFFWWLVVGHVLLGAGDAMRRNVDDALAYSSAVALHKPSLYQKYVRLGVVVLGVAEGTAALAVAGLAWWLGPVAARVAMGLQTLIFMGAAVVAWHVKDPLPVARQLVYPGVRRTILQVLEGRLRDFLRIVAGELRAQPPLRWLTLYAGVIGCTTLTVVHLVQPYLREQQQSLVALALLWAPYHFAWAVFAWFSRYYMRWMGRVMALFSLVAIGVAANALMLYPSLGVYALLLFFFVRGVQTATLIPWLTEYIPQDRVATLLSVRSSLQWIMFIVMNVILGYVTQLHGTDAAFVVSLCVYGSLGILSLFLFVRAEARRS